MNNYCKTMENDEKNDVFLTETCKIGDILERFFNGELESGTEIIINDDVHLIVGDESIETEEEEDLFDMIDTSDLWEEVKIKRDKLNYTAGKLTYASYLPPHSCSVPGVELLSPNKKECHCCPVCNGSGMVPNGFYNSTSGIFITSTTTPITCRSCWGKGYIVL